MDPGRSKCGLALSNADRTAVTEALVLPCDAVIPSLERWHRREPIAGLVLGDGTGSRHWQRSLAGRWPMRLMEEAGSTLAARRRYWQLFPAAGLQRLLPEGLRQPPRDWDDVVAQLLLEREIGRPLIRIRSGPGP
ncbi:resolvase [Synechococcus sp. RSCCF101]|nr:resolvase [Synechococcus sp. RSCCF101]